MIRPPNKLDVSASASSETKRFVAWLNRLQEWAVAVSPIDSPTSSPSVTTKGTHHRAKVSDKKMGAGTGDLPAWL
jgi:hypothetical protein